MSIYICGDTHGRVDTQKIEKYKWPKLTKKDYLIICGDVAIAWYGINFKGDDLDAPIKKYWESKPFTVLFIDGNHENFNVLNNYPVEEWNGGKVHKISNNIYHLMRGQVFTISDKTFFTMGGGVSVDRAYRLPERSWWKEEMPSKEEYAEGLKNLANHNNKVDYILTHAASKEMTIKVLNKIDIDNGEFELNEYFDNIEKNIEFTHWYFGHLHRDMEIDEKHTILYQNIIKI